MIKTTVFQNLINYIYLDMHPIKFGNIDGTRYYKKSVQQIAMIKNELTTILFFIQNFYFRFYQIPLIHSLPLHHLYHLHHHHHLLDLHNNQIHHNHLHWRHQFHHNIHTLQKLHHHHHRNWLALGVQIYGYELKVIVN